MPLIFQLGSPHSLHFPDSPPFPPLRPPISPFFPGAGAFGYLAARFPGTQQGTSQACECECEALRWHGKRAGSRKGNVQRDNSPTLAYQYPFPHCLSHLTEPLWHPPSPLRFRVQVEREDKHD